MISGKEAGSLGAEELSARPAQEVHVRDIAKQIGGAVVLEDITLDVAPGSIVGLSGVNGSGKTMLMRMIAGLVRPTSGSIMIGPYQLGRDISFPPSVGVLIENPTFLPDRTGLANLSIIASIKGTVDEASLMRTMASVGLDPRDRRRFKKYSLGMKQRLGLAAAVMENPELILLDEPANALDSEGVVLLKELLMAQRARGAAIVLSCHDAVLLRELSDEIYHLSEGRIDGHEVLDVGVQR